MSRPRTAMIATVVVLVLAGCGTGLDGATRASRRSSTTTSSSLPTSAAPTTAGRTSTTVESTTTTRPRRRNPADPLSGFRPKPIEWTDCDALQCGRLQVPLDWSKPSGRTIELAVARRRAAGTRVGSLLTNPGGPGASGVEAVDWAFTSSAWTDVRAAYDIVGWDPRGTNDSTKVTCRGAEVSQFQRLDSGPDTPGEQRQLDDAAAAIADACASDGPLLSNITTDDTVLDMEALRRSLRDDHMNFYGFSYGTALGSAYADRFPKRVGRIVLDGVVDPEATLEEFLTEQTVAFEKTLDSMLANCVGCEGGGAALYDRVASRVESRPLPVSSGAVGPAEMAVAAISASYRSDGGDQLVQALSAADGGNGDRLAALADTYYTATDFLPYLAIECVDLSHPMGEARWAAFVDRLEARSPRLGGSVGNELLPCATWPVPARTEPEMPTATGSAPILVIGNTGDSATPYPQAQKMARSLDNATLLTLEGTGHTSYSDPCVDRYAAAYLIEGSLPPKGTVCRG